MYLRMSEGAAVAELEEERSTRFRIGALVLSLIMLVAGPVALPRAALASAHHRHAKHIAGLVLARRADTGGHEHGGEGGGGDDHHGDPGVVPTANSVNQAGTVNSKNASANLAPATQNSVNAVGTKHSKNASANLAPATQNSVNAVGTKHSKNASANLAPATQNSVNAVGTLHSKNMSGH
jgi:hypothetical protein